MKGWKVRKILSGCKEVVAIKRNLKEIQGMMRNFNGPKDPLLRQMRVERKKKIEELCRVVPQLLKNGRWVYSYSKLRRGESNKYESKYSTSTKKQPPAHNRNYMSTATINMVDQFS